MALFFSEESTSLDKDVNCIHEGYKNVPETSRHIAEIYEINKCVDWIRSNGFQKVCLQFPDHLLIDSSEVAGRLQDILNQTIYVLGDTTYESCCIDYVAAAHVEADAIIHFGPICFSQQVGSIPHLYIYEKLQLDTSKIHSSLSSFLKNCSFDDIHIILDTGYYHLQDQLIENLKPFGLKILKICSTKSLQNSVVLFLGSERKLANVNFIFKPKSLYYFSLPDYEVINNEDSLKILKRRYYLIEKIKDSKTFGIVIGTLAVNNYLMVIKRLRKLFDLYKKKYYIISVGKATVAKLANFPEIDIYVLVTCSMNELYKSRDFYRPIATPYDVEVALHKSASDIEFSLDFNSYISQGDPDPVKKITSDTADISLLTGRVRAVTFDDDEKEDASDKKIAIKDKGAIVSTSSCGIGYLNNRTWKGLEQDLGQTPVAKAEKGRSGIAGSYADEGT